MGRTSEMMLSSPPCIPSAHTWPGLVSSQSEVWSLDKGGVWQLSPLKNYLSCWKLIHILQGDTLRLCKYLIEIQTFNLFICIFLSYKLIGLYYTMYYNPLMSLFILVLQLSSVSPVGVPSSELPCLFDFVTIILWVLPYFLVNQDVPLWPWNQPVP